MNIIGILCGLIAIWIFWYIFYQLAKFYNLHFRTFSIYIVFYVFMAIVGVLVGGINLSSEKSETGFDKGDYTMKNLKDTKYGKMAPGLLVLSKKMSQLLGTDEKGLDVPTDSGVKIHISSIVPEKKKY
jgi:hypothetical protein